MKCLFILVFISAFICSYCQINSSILNSINETLSLNNLSDFLRNNEVVRESVSSAAAGAIQVSSMLWLRTIVSYQSNYGVSFTEAVSELYNDGGIFRFYRGVYYALFQVPAARCGSIVGNVLATRFVHSLPETLVNSSFAKAAVIPAVGSLFSGAMKIILMPIDTLRTIQQVQGDVGYSKFLDKLWSTGDISLLYQGTYSTILSNFFGHYPWFFVFNYLNTHLPRADSSVPVMSFSATTIVESVLCMWRSITQLVSVDFYLSTAQTVIEVVSNFKSKISPCSEVLGYVGYGECVVNTVSDDVMSFGYAGLVMITQNHLIRSALISFIATSASDSLTNVFKVVKTVKQTSANDFRPQLNLKGRYQPASLSNEPPSYWSVVQRIVSESGVSGLFGRSLSGRIISNGIQSVVFTVAWQSIAKYLNTAGNDTCNNDNSSTCEAK